MVNAKNHDPLGDIDNLDGNCALRARMDARGLTSLCKPSVTHIAFAHDATFGVELRNSVRAIPCAILAADAGIFTVQDQARGWVFCEGLHRTAFHAGRFQTVIAAHGKVGTPCVRIRATIDFPNASPMNIRRVAVLLIAGHDAALAADAFCHVEVKAILLTFAR